MEIEGKFVSVIFDGTSQFGEVLAVVLRFVDRFKFPNDTTVPCSFGVSWK